MAINKTAFYPEAVIYKHLQKMSLAIMNINCRETEVMQT